MMLLLSILFYFAAAAVVALLGARRERIAAATALTPFVVQLLTVVFLWSDRQDSPVVELDWIPSLGVSIGVAGGTLNLLLTAMVAGVGLLIAIYSAAYFGDPARRARFLALMLVFSGGMAGIVASDDLFGLFVFWEITTVASYLLIGFNHEDASARAAGLQAVLVTTAGGLAMLGGFVLLALAAGTSSISELVADPPTGTSVDVGLGLVFLGAFTKSAQIPFHFWLPGAMAAPTPASAYLHSATMVKAGIVLLVFLAPGFAADPLWTVVVTSVGLATMVVGAVAAISRTDLKLLLAHGTVSQLGFMVALVGLGHTAATVAMLLAHALFKATLFLVVGAIDHATGTRDIRRLSGLGRRLPGLAATAAVAAISMAGAPPTLGFVTKEGALDRLVDGAEWMALVIIAAASALTVVYTARFWLGAFAAKPGMESSDAGQVRPGLWLGPAVLAGLTMLFGLWPAWLEAVTFDAVGEKVKLVLWPGFTTALGVSTAILTAGSGLYVAYSRWERHTGFRAVRRSGGERAYAAALRGLNRVADRVTGTVQSGSLPTYLAVILTAVLVVPAVVWLTSVREAPSLQITNGPAEVVLAVAVAAGGVAAAVAQRRMAAALLLGLVGYSVAGIYVVFSAPDLALTQVLIETLTIALFALVLVKLPRRFGPGPRSLSHRARVAIAVFVGLFVTTAAVLASTVEHDRTIADRYAARAPEAGGKNVVNVILTNFRAIDTLGEITVLAAAAVGISALVRRARRPAGERAR